MSCLSSPAPHHKGLKYIAFKLAASENSASPPNKPQNSITRNLESSLHILKEISYYLITLNISPIDVKIFISTIMCGYRSSAEQPSQRKDTLEVTSISSDEFFI